MEVLKMHDTVTLEQVIAVPKISCPPRPLRAVLSEPQMAEQFVEQNADIPVPGARSVPGYGGLQGFLPGQGSLQRAVEQIVDILVPGGGPHEFLPDPGSAAHSAVSREELLLSGFFELFHVGKSAEAAWSPSARVHAHSSSWTPAAYETPDLLLLGDMAGDQRKKRSEEEREQTAKWIAWMEENNRRKKEVKLRKQKMMLETFVQAILEPLLLGPQTTDAPVPQITTRVCAGRRNLLT